MMAMPYLNHLESIQQYFSKTIENLPTCYCGIGMATIHRTYL